MQEHSTTTRHQTFKADFRYIRFSSPIISLFSRQFGICVLPVSSWVGLVVDEYLLTEHLHRLVADAEGLRRDL